MNCVCSGCMPPCYIGVLSMQSMEYCMGLYVWGLEVCAHLVVGGVCVAEVCGGGLRCWGLCVFVISLCVGCGCLVWWLG